MKRRRLVKLVVFLLLGAIVNVAVAWGLCMWTPLQPISAMQRFRNHPEWLVTEFPKGFGTRSAFLVSDAPHSSRAGNPRELVPTWSCMAGRLASGGLEGGDGLYEQARGWPCLSLTWHALVSGVGGTLSTVRLHCGWGLGKDPINDGALPLRPIWPGFAINTVFYAVILWLLFAAPFALRRRRRIRRGLCPACAYPVGDSAVCTECGGPINARDRQ